MSYRRTRSSISPGSNYASTGYSSRLSSPTRRTSLQQYTEHDHESSPKSARPSESNSSIVVHPSSSLRKRFRMEPIMEQPSSPKRSRKSVIKDENEKAVHFRSSPAHSTNSTPSTTPVQEQPADQSLPPEHSRGSDGSDFSGTDGTRLLRPRKASVYIVPVRRYVRRCVVRSSNRAEPDSEESGTQYSRNANGDVRIRRSSSRLAARVAAAVDRMSRDPYAGDEEDESNGRKSKTQQQQGAVTRRYPRRNRRSTNIYQVEFRHHAHTARNWLAGTGYETARRVTRSSNRKSDEHMDLHCYDTSDTSSSIDSDSGSPGFPRSPTYSQSGATRNHRRWFAADASTPDPAPTSTASAGVGDTIGGGSIVETANPDDHAAVNASSIDPDELKFARRCAKSILRSRADLMPFNLTGKAARLPSPSKRSDRVIQTAATAGSTAADIGPMTIDHSIGFDQVGGHDAHIAALKESIMLPLVYPEVFSQFGIDPPRGVLFCGPPGTGKTLLARALANECSRLNYVRTGSQNEQPNRPLVRRPIAFFMRKGADCLSKWVGEAERQLRLLFDQAFKMRPSIIFFDEIDGLAPVRSSKQDQIHSSIVSTLLSLMDGLDQRTEVVIIGATNRPDALDPALRRPGRFDREFQFQLPGVSVRQRILEVHTSKWNPKPSSSLLKQLATATLNFSGADLKSLTTEACLCCLRRHYPQVYQSQKKLALDSKYLVVSRADWIQALRLIRPSSERADVDASVSNLTPAAGALACTKRAILPLQLEPLLQPLVNRLSHLISQMLAFPDPYTDLPTSTDPLFSASSSARLYSTVLDGLNKSRLLVTGADIPDSLIAAVWQRFESVQIYTINSTNLFAFPTSIGMCPEAAFAQILSSARCNLNATSNQAPNINNPHEPHSNSLENISGVILYFPRIDLLFSRLSAPTVQFLTERLHTLLSESDLRSMYSSAHFPSLEQGEESTTFGHLSNMHPRRIILFATTHRTQIPAWFRSAPAAPSLPISDTDSNHPSDSLSHHVEKEGAVIRQTTSSVGKKSSHKRDRDLNKKFFNGISSSRKAAAPMTEDASNWSVEFEGRQFQPPSSAPRNFRKEPRSVTRLSTATVVSDDGLRTNHMPASSESASPTSVDGSWTESRKLNGPISPIQNCLDTRLLEPPSLLREDIEVQRSGSIENTDELLSVAHLSSVFPFICSVCFPLYPPSVQTRTDFFKEVLIDWPCRRWLCNSGVSEHLDRAPSPVPLCEESRDANEQAQAQLTSEELLEIERQEAQLFRRLRQVLRRVVAHLARHRRFVVFARPVQVDEAPDYYDVIKQPMDLGTVRDKIDTHNYQNIETFMNDIQLIYHNALEYNPPNVPRSRDIRSRAFELWDEACLQIEEELHPPSLNDQCKAATAAQEARSVAQRVQSSSAVEQGSGDVQRSSNAYDHHRNRSSSGSGSNGRTSSVSTQSTLATTQSPPAMAHTDRYSRRLHGEPPSLDPSVALGLQSSSRRRRGSSSASASTSVTTVDGGVQSQRTEHALASPISTSSWTGGHAEPMSPSYTTECPRLPSRRVINNSASPTELNRAVLVDDRSLSPDLSKTRTQLTDEASQESDSHLSQSNISVTGVDRSTLHQFLHRIVSETNNWSIENLVRLHANFSKLILWRYARVSDRSGIHADLEQIFQEHLKFVAIE